jgi:4Fe-4S ferredoxin
MVGFENKRFDVVIDVDPSQCIFCGICEVLCPFGAIRIYVNDQHVIPVLETDSFPKLKRDIKIDAHKCRHLNLLCERVCTQVCPSDLLVFNNSNPPPVIHDPERCHGCGWCESACRSVIRAEKIFDGVIKINNELCPPGCEDCVNNCPTDALYVDEEGKVDVVNEFCIFCGACLNFCQMNRAIDIKITHVNVTTTKSKTWDIVAKRLSSHEFPRKLSIASPHWRKVIKQDNDNELFIECSVYLRKYTLKLNKNLCKKCRICALACPKSAIEIKRK